MIGESGGTPDKRIIFEEQMPGLQRRLELLESRIAEAEQILSARPWHGPTLSRYNILCHSRSEVKTKIRKLKERMGIE